MKKLLSIILAMSMCIGLFACAKQTSTANATNEGSVAAVQETKAE